MSAFGVHCCTENDIHRVFEIASLAFANDHEYMDAVFPAHSTCAGRKAGAERMIQMFRGDPHGYFIKAVDNESGRIVGAAKWNLYNGGDIPPQPYIDGDYWSNEEEKEFAQCLFYSFFAPRQRVIEETGACLAGMLQHSPFHLSQIN